MFFTKVTRSRFYSFLPIFSFWCISVATASHQGFHYELSAESVQAGDRNATSFAAVEIEGVLVPRELFARQSTSTNSSGQAGGNSASSSSNDFTCSPDKPCGNGACCGASGWCGYGPGYCGDGVYHRFLYNSCTLK
jgi:hypothetical protein